MVTDEKLFEKGVDIISSFSSIAQLGLSRKVALEGMVGECLKDHPTNQQSIVRFMVEFLQKYGESVKFVDLRNEEAANFCKSLAQQDLHFPYI